MAKPILVLRDLDPKLLLHLRRRADEQELGLDQLVERLLWWALRYEESSRWHHDLDHHLGVWSAEQAEEFDDALREQRQIDIELWD